MSRVRVESDQPAPVSLAEYEWGTHAIVCKHCKDVKLERPATLARCCLEGAELLKRALSARNRKKPDARDVS